MKFAFLTSSYYSNEDANGICVKNIVDVLKKEGHIIYILSEGNEKEKSVDGLRCFFVKETVLKKIKNFYQDNRSVVSLILYKIVSIIRKIFLGITSFFLFPNVSPIRTQKVYKAIKRINSMDKMDCVIGTFRPYDNIAAINKFKKNNPHIKTIIVYLDMLEAQNPFGRVFKKYFKYLCDKSEIKTIGLNDLVLIPESYKSKYNNKYENYKDKIRFFDFPLFTAKQKNAYLKDVNDTLIRIVYAGSIDGKNRSVLYFLKIINELVDKYNLNIQLDIYGKFNELNVYNEYRDSQFVNFKGMINAEQVYEVLCKADFILNISNKITYQMIPSKIFQLFSTCNSIINIVANEKDASMEYFNKYSDVVNIKEYEEDIERDVELVKTFIKDKERIKPDFNQVLQCYKNNTPEAFIDKLLI